MGDSIVIFLLALMLFGPKKLPQLARQLGKLMAEFRKASNDFRMQMEDELRIEEQREHQAKIDASKPPPPAVAELPAQAEATLEASTEPAIEPSADDVAPSTAPPAPIAESGDLRMMPPSSGLPAESSARGRSYTSPSDHGHAEANGHGNGLPHIPEHSIGGDTIATQTIGAGTSSEEPAAELGAAPDPTLDRSHPAMSGEGVRATHV